MELLFLNSSHEEKFLNLIQLDKSNPYDEKRKALFYIIAGNQDLYFKRNAIYDFHNRSIKRECLEDGSVDFCSSSRKLVNLAYILFNNYKSEYTITDILSLLDNNNFNLALNSIKIRFDKF